MKYKISIITSVYNAEKYLEDTIKSVINQDINFKKNIEYILVDDGSTDKSKEICLKYCKLYKDNIKYIYKENSGVSDTRNIGFKASNGEYVMFLDSDDLINNKSIRLTSKFLDIHKNVDFVISRVRMFDAMDKWHYMDYRFKSNKKIVNINNDIKYCQYHSTGVLIRRTAIENIRFDKNVKYGEDMKFMSEILINNPQFGIEKRSILYYRKRQEETSAVQTQFKDKKYYLNTMKDSFLYTLSLAEKKYGYIPQYFEYYIMNSLCERFLLSKPDYNIFDILSKKEYNEYLDYFIKMIEKFDDHIILMQERLSLNHKFYILNKIKNKKAITKYIGNNLFSINNDSFQNRKKDICKILNVSLEKNDITFIMTLNDYILKPSIIINNTKITPKEIAKPKDDLIETYYDIKMNELYNEKVYEIKYNLNKLNDLKITIEDKPVNYFVSATVVKHNALPYMYKKIGKHLLIFKNNKIVMRKHFITCISIFYKTKNLLYILKRDGLENTIKRIRSKISG